MPKQSMFLINDIDFMLKVWDRAKANGKKPGDDCQKEFDELVKEFPEAVTFIGHTEKDIDLLSGDAREAGIKVINMNEINHKG